MSDYYQIVSDVSKLDEFIEWLPDTGDDTQFYVTLLARKKYSPGHPALSGDKMMIKRFTSQKERLKNKLRQLECRAGTYLGKDGIPIPQESLAVYITPFPRDLKAASYKAIQEFASKLGKGEAFNPRNVMMNIIQTSGTGGWVMDMDFDDPVKLDEIRQLTCQLATIVKTRGGYHLIIRPETMKDIATIQKANGRPNWFVDVRKHADVVGDAVTPIVGCFQGGFTPHFLNK